MQRANDLHLREAMYQRILVAIDGSPPSFRALDEAIALAHDQRAHLRVVSVLDLRPLFMGNVYLPSLDEILKTMRDAGEATLAQAKDRAQHAGITVDTALLESDDERISQVIVDEAVRSGADLVVVGTHGHHGIEHLLLGSVAEGVARASSVPVLLVHAARPGSAESGHEGAHA